MSTQLQTVVQQLEEHIVSAHGNQPISQDTVNLLLDNPTLLMGKNLMQRFILSYCISKSSLLLNERQQKLIRFLEIASLTGLLVTKIDNQHKSAYFDSNNQETFRKVLSCLFEELVNLEKSERIIVGSFLNDRPFLKKNLTYLHTSSYNLFGIKTTVTE